MAKKKTTRKKAPRKKKVAKRKPVKQAGSRQPKGRADHLVATRFQPGQSGNPKGRKPGTSMTDQLRKIIDGAGGKGEVRAALMKAGVAAALRGDFRFWQEILNRMDGKVPDHLATQGEVEVIIRHVDESNDQQDD